MIITATYADRRAKKNVAGLCVNCSRPRKGIFTQCEICLSGIRKNVKRYKWDKIEKGLCWDCPNKRERLEIRRCNTCNNRNTARLAAHKAEKKQ